MGQNASSLWQTKPTEITIEEKKEIITERDNFYNDMKEFQKKVITERDAEKISPETAEELIALVSAFQEWLRKNPNANILEVRSQRDDLNQKAEPIRERDAPKTMFDVYILSYWYDLDKNKDAYKSEQYKSARLALDNEAKWLKANPGERGLVYTQRLDGLKQTLATSLGIPKSNLDSFEQNLKTQKVSAVRKNIREAVAAAETKDKQEFKTSRFFQTAGGTAALTILIVLVVTVVIFGASLAANMAIIRTPGYRIFYFIFGLLPWLTPFIYAYAALLSIQGNAPRYYGILPISTEPATTRLGKLMWFPFYYTPDKELVNATAAYETSVQSVAQRVLSVTKAFMS